MINFEHDLNDFEVSETLKPEHLVEGRNEHLNDRIEEKVEGFGFYFNVRKRVDFKVVKVDQFDVFDLKDGRTGEYAHFLEGGPYTLTDGWELVFDEPRLSPLRLHAPIIVKGVSEVREDWGEVLEIELYAGDYDEHAISQDTLMDYDDYNEYEKQLIDFAWNHGIYKGGNWEPVFHDDMPLTNSHGEVWVDWDYSYGGFSAQGTFEWEAFNALYELSKMKWEGCNIHCDVHLKLKNNDGSTTEYDISNLCDIMKDEWVSDLTDLLSLNETPMDDEKIAYILELLFEVYTRETKVELKADDEAVFIDGDESHKDVYVVPGKMIAPLFDVAERYMNTGVDFVVAARQLDETHWESYDVRYDGRQVTMHFLNSKEVADRRQLNELKDAERQLLIEMQPEDLKRNKLYRLKYIDSLDEAEEAIEGIKEAVRAVEMSESIGLERVR